jgi:cytochrome c oxidase subunit II
MSGTPLDYIGHAAGSRAGAILPLTWFTLVVSIVVIVIIAALVLRASLRFRARGGASETVGVPVERGADGLRWITIGLALTAVPLLVTLVWTMAALAQVAGPPLANPGLVLDVTPHQWWWEVQYNGATPDAIFETANEIHIPTGTKVLVRLHGGDVIHSFWVPRLSGKTDAIPGQNNLSWLDADQPGVYRGQCAEYCGWQHAKMAFEVVAEPPAQFAAWRDHQLADAPQPTTPRIAQGQAIIVYRCGLCHAVRGTDAGARTAPDLTHLMSRRMIAAGVLPNTPGALLGWVQHPQGVKPDSLMPDQHLSGAELTAVGAYLETLR